MNDADFAYQKLRNAVHAAEGVDPTYIKTKTHVEAAVQLMHTAIANATAVDPAFKAALTTSGGLAQAERRVQFLEQSIRDFCEFMAEYGMEGMGDKFHARFRDLCEAVGFDADEYGREGYNREDV